MMFHERSVTLNLIGGQWYLAFVNTSIDLIPVCFAISGERC